jgi:hypothetical protein
LISWQFSIWICCKPFFPLLYNCQLLCIWRLALSIVVEVFSRAFFRIFDELTVDLPLRFRCLSFKQSCPCAVTGILAHFETRTVRRPYPLIIIIIIIQSALQPLVGFGLLYDFIP